MLSSNIINYDAMDFFAVTYSNKIIHSVVIYVYFISRSALLVICLLNFCDIVAFRCKCPSQPATLFYGVITDDNNSHQNKNYLKILIGEDLNIHYLDVWQSPSDKL